MTGKAKYDALALLTVLTCQASLLKLAWMAASAATTVMHACKRAAARIAEDPQAYETVRRLTEQLGGTE